MSRTEDINRSTSYLAVLLARHAGNHVVSPFIKPKLRSLRNANMVDQGQKEDMKDRATIGTFFDGMPAMDDKCTTGTFLMWVLKVARRLQRHRGTSCDVMQHISQQISNKIPERFADLSDLVAIHTPF